MNPRTAPGGLLEKLVATLLATVLLVVGFMFSVVLLAVVAVVGIVGLGYFWWRTRALRRAIRQQMAAANLRQSTVIEGQATVVRDAPRAGDSPLPITDKAG